MSIYRDLINYKQFLQNNTDNSICRAFIADFWTNTVKAVKQDAIICNYLNLH